MIQLLSILPFEFPYGFIFFITALVVIFYLWTQHKQKLELIKKGESIIQVDALEQMKFRNLGRGILTVSLALGIIFANLLATYTVLNEFILYVAMVFLFFGIGSLIFYCFIKNK